MRTIKSIFLVVASFCIAFEIISFCGNDEIAINVNDEGYSYFDKANSETVFFVGDSYASTNYAEQGYPVLFREYFKSRDWNFVDLSKAGSELSYHKHLLDSINDLNPRLVIYFYNISDIVSLKNGTLQPHLPTSKKEKSTKNLFKQTSDWVANQSATVIFFKKVLHHVSMLLTDEYLPGTPAYKFPRQTVKYREQLGDIFSGIHAENVLVFVNTPFSAGVRPKSWLHYKVFEDLKQGNGYVLIQAVDVVNNPDYAISWRNGHPNQDAIRIISDSLIQVFDTFN